MTALQQLIKIIKQKRKESEISNTLLRFVHDEAIRLLEKEKKQQIYNMTNGNKASVSKEQLLEIYKKEL
jgi:hypothetical protein